MIINKSDLTAYAQDLGCWNTLLEMAGLNLSEANNDVDLEIVAVRVPGVVVLATPPQDLPGKISLS